MHTTIVIIRMKTATIAPINIGLLLFEGETAGVTNVDRDIEFVELPTSGDWESTVVDVAITAVGVLVEIVEVVIKMTGLMVMFEETVEILKVVVPWTLPTDLLL